MLAARALGLATVLTTLHTSHEQEVKELLAIPDNVDTAALIPLGYPAEGQRFTSSRRRPLHEVMFYEKWGHTRHRFNFGRLSPDVRADGRTGGAS